MKRVIISFAVLGSLFIFAGLGHADTFFVAPNGSSSNVPCNVSAATPCDFQTGLNQAAQTPADDTIEMENGIYNAPPPNQSPFVYFGFAGGALTIQGNGAIIDGGRHLDNTGNTVGNPGLLMFTINPNQSDSTFTLTLTGITFQNGVFKSFDGAGLGIETGSADVNILHCNFLNNDNTNANGTGGGGLSVVSNNSGNIVLIGNKFDKNLSLVGGGAATLGAVLGDITLIGNTVTDNISAASAGGSGGGQGGGITAAAEGGNLIASRNFFSGNLGGNGGGFFGIVFVQKLVLTDNIFIGNQGFNPTSTPNSGGAGAALIAEVSNGIVITNNTFTDNKMLNGNGAGLAVLLEADTDGVDIYNNIIFNNLASGSSCTKSCNDIFVFDDGDTNNNGSPVNVFNNDFSDIEFQCDPTAGCTPHRNVDGVTNKDKDPMFVNAGSSDLRLLAGSPAIDAGSPTAPNLPTIDFEGNLRNLGAAPDMGAFESKPGENPQPGSENCSNNVDDDGNGLIDCNDPACSGSAACTGGEGGGGGGGVTPNAGNGGGCSMTATSGSSSSVFYLVLPLLFAAGALIRKSQSSRGE
jgi:hypothetical protein